MRKCNKCNLIKEFSEFYTNGKGKYYSICKPCRKEQVRYRYHNEEEFREITLQKQKERTDILKENPAYKKLLSDRALSSRNIRKLLDPVKLHKLESESKKRFLEKCWSIAFQKYGDICKCCGENNKLFLTLDHINNDGNEDRKNFKGSIHSWLKKNDYPDTIQILCWNCNMGKNRNKGLCPHKI